SLLSALAKPRSCAGSVPVLSAPRTADATFAGIPGSSALDGVTDGDAGGGGAGTVWSGVAAITAPGTCARLTSVVATAPGGGVAGATHARGRGTLSPGRRGVQGAFL